MVTKRNSALQERHRATIRKSHPPCWICGQPIDWTAKYPDPDSFVVDHKVPVTRGGADTLSNKAAAHQRCNRLKSNRLDGGPVIRRSGSLNL